MVFTLTPYTKPSHTALQIVAKLQAQGLVVSDAPATEAFLGRVNYYRFRGYLYPYFDRGKARPWQFIAGTDVEQARQMYRFDEELRHLLFGVISQIEILLRTKLDATMSLAAGDGFWYLEQKWFHRQRFPQRIIDSLHAEFTRSREEFAQHYHRSYYNQVSPSHKGLPPFWVVADLTTLGQTREVFRALDQNARAFGHTAKTPASTPLDKMAQSLGAASFDILLSWIDALRAMRNLCAHHTRLWNRNLAAPRSIDVPAIVSISPVGSGHRNAHNTTYTAILVIRQISKVSGLTENIKDGLNYLLQKYPEADRSKAAMGMPNNWDTCRIWQN